MDWMIMTICCGGYCWVAINREGWDWSKVSLQKSCGSKYYVIGTTLFLTSPWSFLQRDIKFPGKRQFQWQNTNKVKLILLPSSWKNFSCPVVLLSQVSSRTPNCSKSGVAQTISRGSSLPNIRPSAISCHYIFPTHQHTNAVECSALHCGDSFTPQHNLTSSIPVFALFNPSPSLPPSTLLHHHYHVTSLNNMPLPPRTKQITTQQSWGMSRSQGDVCTAVSVLTGKEEHFGL